MTRKSKEALHVGDVAASKRLPKVDTNATSWRVNKPASIVDPCGRIHGRWEDVRVERAMSLGVARDGLHKAFLKPETSFG